MLRDICFAKRPLLMDRTQGIFLLDLAVIQKFGAANIDPYMNISNGVMSLVKR